MSDISLSKAVRSNLLSLQNTASMMAKTQERLATGNKVNSALDNPTNFFTASALNSRAGDLGQLMDSMANGIQTLEAADNGLTAITKTLESMQSTLRQARQDKSFTTQSYEVGGGTGNISFSGGAVGASTRAIGLQNTALTKEAVGLDSGTTAGTAGVTPSAGGPTAPTSGSATFTIGTLGTLDTGETMDFDVTVDTNPATPVSFTKAEWDAVAAETTAADRADLFASTLATKLAGVATVAAENGEITITSLSTGTSSNVAIDAAAKGGTAGSGTATGADIGLGSAVSGTAGQAAGTSPAVAGVKATSTFDWGGAALEMNKDAKISFTAKIGGQDQKIEITRADVLKAGNGDGTIDDAEEFAAILSSKIEGASFAASGNTITMTSDTERADATFGLSAATVTGTNYNADELVQKINSDSNLVGKIRASNDNGKLRIENQSTQELNVDGVDSKGTIVGGTTAGVEKIGGNTVRSDLSKQFNELRDQLDKLADDASFNGINLLRGDKLTITFNETGTSSIDIQTKGEKQVNASNLDIFNIDAADLDSDANIDSLLGDLKTALNSVRSQSSAFGSNLSIVQNRQDFTKNMINTLQTGGANLTLADMNEEAANLLALQTRQSLSSNSLSLASQADQSVLQLIR